MKCMLIGNYGVGNLGDELLREYFLRAFPEVEWLVVSAQPKVGEYPRLPGGIRSFLMSDWDKTWKAMRKVDAVVFGGGSLFTDTESTFACFLWWLHARFAAFFTRPLVFAFQGIGPFRTAIGRWFAKDALRRATLITVRDPQSVERVRALGVNTKIIQSFDPIFSLFQEQKPESRSQEVFILIPRANSGESFIRRAKEISAACSYARVVILTLQPDDAKEQQFCSHLRAELSIPSDIHPVRNAAGLQLALRDAGLVLTERYHGALAALALGKTLEIVSQKAGDKLDALRPYVTGERSIGELRDLVRKGEEALRYEFHLLPSMSHADSSSAGA